MKPSFSVVICAHDEHRWESLVTAVESVRSQSLTPHEVVVVVDHNDALLARVMSSLDDVIAEPNAHARGLAGARNTGVAAASGDVVAFLDDDALAEPDWLARLAHEYEGADTAGVGGGIVPRWEVERPTWFPPEFDWVVGCTYRGLPEERASVRNLIGCNMSFRRSLLEELDGFRLGYGCDETEFCIRLRHRHPELTLVYVPQARVHHLVPAARARPRYFIRRCFFEGGSKAVVSQLVGRASGLASERDYARRVLPAGIVRGLRESVRRRDGEGAARALAIVVGFASTAAGFAVGRLRARRAAAARGWEGALP